eukprot:CAMPEP_0195308934 /NCGR_PEP_ID=MMETSP0707-20130614/38483_1 /TAXON_ID=33640 /ORGANISM="Asterionellopsis glacialis, Strain CCMP134" /LENGTH=356 /DNA_ID=CAMNT_0040373225 /DNA_START=94 /DNA_END=1161 /DNA_ORIENTATION=+
MMLLRSFSLTLLLLVSHTRGFLAPSLFSFHSNVCGILQHKRHVNYATKNTSLSMISFGGGGSNQKKTSELPRDVKDAVSKCRAAVQEALGSRLSRMDIEMPVGTKFGVEKDSSSKKKKKFLDSGNNDMNAPTRDSLDKSDRELARLFVEMFQPVGGEHISVMFNDEDLADAAKKRWKDGGAACRIANLGKRSKSKVKRGMGGGNKKKKKAVGFAAKMNEEVGNNSNSGPFQLPEGTEVAIFVAPGPKELLVVERICSEVGMDTLVLLLNARLDNIENFGTDSSKTLFMDNFEPVFQLKAAPQDAAPGCLLYRAYPNDWVMARKPKAGQPKPVFEQAQRPTSEECRQEYDKIEIGDM